jgi:hypothetical protein
MGVSLPELPPAHPDDNINLGDRDSIRRRALWALEGKPDMAFSRVEIPDIPSPDSPKAFEFRQYPLPPLFSSLTLPLATKPSFPPGSGLNGVAAKRDSLKLFGSKDHLGTLVEEEEEEEEDTQTPKETPPKITPRHRPASLNLRPLSLVQGSVVSPLAGSLPTPTLTPGSRPSRPTGISVRQTHFSYSCDSALDKKRRSSISYKRSTESVPLPTPEMTPTERRFSFASDQETLIERPLSVADQHFLFRSHRVLLSRITELERTLKNQASRSRHIPYASDPSPAASEPSDEMLQLISDLKAERDELGRDVDGWRQRVADADKQASMLARRIESERRDAWVARSRLGLLEVEKSGLEKSMQVKAAALSQSMVENESLVRERDGMKLEIMKLNARLKDADAAVNECTRLCVALDQERTRRKDLEKLLDDAGLLNTPTLPHAVNRSWRRPSFPVKPAGTRPRGLGFQSVDSESSTTDVESVDDSFAKAEFTLDAVAEEAAEFSDEENGLAGYEDEEDSDLSYSSPGGSSISSADELDIEPEAIADHPTHESRPSLSKTWTFPRGKTATFKQDDEVDRFFGCLDDVERSPPRSEEMNQSAFSSAFRSVADDDELPPFVLPSDVGVVIESSSSDAVPGEDEEDDVTDTEGDDLIGEEVEGGIRFTFSAPPIMCVTPPPDVCVTPPPEIRITPPTETPPAVRPRMDDDDESSLTFVFPPKIQPRRVAPVTSPPPPTCRPSSRDDSPPSSIPRAVSLRSMSPRTPSIMFTPSKNVSGRFTAPLAYSTPPSRKTPSSIPQPVTSPRSYSTPTKAQTSVILSKQSQSSTPNGSFKLYTSTLDSFISCASQPTILCPLPDTPAPRKVAAPRRR